MPHQTAKGLTHSSPWHFHWQIPLGLLGGLRGTAGSFSMQMTPHKAPMWGCGSSLELIPGQLVASGPRHNGGPITLHWLQYVLRLLPAIKGANSSVQDRRELPTANEGQYDS